MKEKERMPLEVIQRPNGWTLCVGDNRYLYYTICQLFEGMLYHAGMCILEDANEKEIKEAVNDFIAFNEQGRKQMMDANQQLAAEVIRLQKKNDKLTAEIGTVKATNRRLKQKLHIEDD